MSLTAIRVPLWVHEKALVVLFHYRKGIVHHRHLTQPGRLSLRVTQSWRLLSKNNGKDWVVISHERYNKLKNRK